MNELHTELAALTGRSLYAQLVALMPEIDAKMKAGVGQGEIVETLNRGGLKITIGIFRTYLYRYRRNRRDSSPIARPIENFPHSDRIAGNDPEPITDGNPQPEIEAPEPESLSELDGSLSDILDPKKRDALTDKYFQKPALIGRKRSKSE